MKKPEFRIEPYNYQMPTRVFVEKIRGLFGTNEVEETLEMLQTPRRGKTILLAWAKDEVVGYAYITTWIQMTLEFVAARVRPDFRQQGILTQFVDQAIKIARSRGIRIVTLESPGDVPQNRMYIRKGFTPNPRPNGDIVFKKKL